MNPLLPRSSMPLLCGLWLSSIGAAEAWAGSQASAVEPPSAIQLVHSERDQWVLRTSVAEFAIGPSGYVQGFLLKEGRRLSLDDPGKDASDSVTIGGTVARIELDLGRAKVFDMQGRLGHGKRLEIPDRAASVAGLRRVLALEVYDEMPSLVFTTQVLRNEGHSDLRIKQAVAQRRRLNASLGGVAGHPCDLWSFQGSSYDWGADEIVKLRPGFSRSNVMGRMVKGGYGGGIPVVAFWTGSVGEAIGHVENKSLDVSLPVKVRKDGRVDASMVVPVSLTLKPGETYVTPTSFLAVYAGDFYEPLRMWSSALVKQGWELVKPSREAYSASWCGWGYGFDVTPAQMLATVPKLKEFHIKWATLDDRWFDVYGDWNPRSDTFPGDSIKTMVDGFHREGELVQIWWLPLAVEDGQGKYESHKYALSQVVREHPDWLILDEHGRHARITRNLAALDPSLPEVQAYYKAIAEKFIRDWGFDGHKLDNIYTVPPCYNPAHHHTSPMESVWAVGDVYKAIFQATRALKPESVTQSCPCGTTPSLAWLPYLDQAVTADPVGAAQVRRRIKMYKALLGPESAVYGDHVELSAMSRKGKGEWREFGTDFASTIGVGGVVGTKFVWPDVGPKFKDVALTPDKSAHWKKWLDIGHDKMLADGTFRNLYVHGYDVPEGYAIEKEGRMYYAFFVQNPARSWHDPVELRGLKPGKYRVADYEHGKDLGTIEVSQDRAARLKVSFKDHLLLEVVP